MHDADDTPPNLGYFRVCCPTCGRDSDAEDAVFVFNDLVRLPGIDFVLLAITCETCASRLDCAVWPVNTEPDGVPLEDEADLEPETLALRARYDGAIAEYTAAWEHLYAERETDLWRVDFVDLSGVALFPEDMRQTVFDMRVLAAAQACRAVTLRFPEQRPVMLLAGPYGCALSLERIAEDAPGHSWHLSVSHTAGLGWLRQIELAFLAALYFTTAERPFLRAEAGRMVRCTHIWCLVPSMV